MSAKGQELFDQAEKKLKKWFSFGNKHEEAGELFVKAANQFKLSKEWKSAGTAFMRASDCFHHSGESYGCTENLVEAARCFKKVRCDDAVLCYQSAADLRCDDGKFSEAAKLLKELAEYYRENEDCHKAVESYKKAADFYSGEEQTTSANSVTLEAGKLYAEQLGMPDEAIKSFETVAKSYLQHGSMKYHVKDLLVKCMMCRFQMVRVENLDEMLHSCKEALVRYEGMDISFPGTREAELCEEVLAGAMEAEPKKIATAAAKYEEIKTLDDFQVGAILYLKKLIEESEDNLM